MGGGRRVVKAMTSQSRELVSVGVSESQRMMMMMMMMMTMMTMTTMTMTMTCFGAACNGGSSRWEIVHETLGEQGVL